MKWKGTLINKIIELLKDDKQWEDTIEKVLVDNTIGIHLAIFNEPYLSLIFKKEKKIESRFSQNKRIPFENIKKGDIVILKESGGFVTGIFVAGDVRFFTIKSKATLDLIKFEYAKEICSHYDKEFWNSRITAKYATLIEVKKVKKVKPFKIEKKDRSAWSVIREGIITNLFNQLK